MPLSTPGSAMPASASAAPATMASTKAAGRAHCARPPCCVAHRPTAIIASM